MVWVASAPCQWRSPASIHTESPGPIVLCGLASQLYASNSGQDVQSLTHRMGVPGGARARFERDAIHGKS